MRQVYFTPDGNAFFDLILEVFLMRGIVLVPLVDPPPQGFQASEGDVELPPEGANVRQGQICFALDPSGRMVRALIPVTKPTSVGRGISTFAYLRPSSLRILIR